MSKPEPVAVRSAILLISVLFGISQIAPAQPPPVGQTAPPAKPQPKPIDAPFTPMITLGGQVFWADELVYLDWRIQRNAFTERCRLLDGKNLRHAYGSFEVCQSALDQLKRKRGLQPMSGKAVLVLHGLGSVRLVASQMADYLRKESDYQAFCLSYPSQFDDIGSHARSLASVIEHLDGIEEINFVGHSMGNLVIRHYLADAEAAGKSDPRIKRIVMIAPPNNGAEMLATYGNNPLIAVTHGISGQQLGKLWPLLAPRLAIPTCEFGIIAGGRGTSSGMLPLLDGDNDGLVTVASTRLAGARDFIVVPAGHIAQLYSADIQRYAVSFLKKGYFVTEEQRHPID